MAQVVQQNDLNDQNKPQQPGQAPPGTITSYNPNKQQGSGYTNIQRVVQANQGNQLGQAIGGGIQQQAGQQQQAVGQAQQDFNQQTQQNQANTQGNQNLVNSVLNDPTKYANAQGNDPNAQQGSQFQNLISGQYQGPQQLNNAQQLQSQAQDVGQLGQAIGSQGGQIGLLQRFVGNPQYNTGQQKLDALLLGQTGGPQLAEARKAALQTQAQTSGALLGAQNVGQEQSNLAQQFGQTVQGQLGSNVSSQEQALQKQATDAQTARDTKFADIQKQLQSGQITQDEADQLGIQAGQMTFGIDPSKYLTASNLKANESNIASDQDYARMQALQKLSGGAAPQSAQDTFGKFQDPTQAGKFAASNAYDVDKAGYQKAYGASQDQYHSELDPAQQRVSAAQQMQRLGAGQFNDQDRAEAAAAGIDVHYLAQTKYPGAVHGGGMRADWAAANLASAQQNLAQTQARLNSAYGNAAFGILPGQQPNPDQGQS